MLRPPGGRGLELGPQEGQGHPRGGDEPVPCGREHQQRATKPRCGRRVAWDSGQRAQQPRGGPRHALPLSPRAPSSACGSPQLRGCAAEGVLGATSRPRGSPGLLSQLRCGPRSPYPAPARPRLLLFSLLGQQTPGCEGPEVWPLPLEKGWHAGWGTGWGAPSTGESAEVQTEPTVQPRWRQVTHLPAEGIPKCRESRGVHLVRFSCACIFWIFLCNFWRGTLPFRLLRGTLGTMLASWGGLEALSFQKSTAFGGIRGRQECQGRLPGGGDA